jgi:hypothetical protein
VGQLLPDGVAFIFTKKRSGQIGYSETALASVRHLLNRVSGGDVHADALDRLNHAALSLEKMGYVLALIRLPRDRVGGNRFA